MISRTNLYCLLAEYVGEPTAPYIEFVSLNVPERTFTIRIKSTLIHHQSYSVVKMVLSDPDDKKISFQLALSENPLQVDVVSGNIALDASDGTNTTGQIDVSVSVANSSMLYYVIATYILKDSNISQPIGWMHSGGYTSFSFRKFLSSMVHLLEFVVDILLCLNFPCI